MDVSYTKPKIKVISKPVLNTKESNFTLKIGSKKNEIKLSNPSTIVNNNILNVQDKNKSITVKGKNLKLRENNLQIRKGNIVKVNDNRVESKIMINKNENKNIDYNIVTGDSIFNQNCNITKEKDDNHFNIDSSNVYQNIETKILDNYLEDETNRCNLNNYTSNISNKITKQIKSENSINSNREQKNDILKILQTKIRLKGFTMKRYK